MSDGVLYVACGRRYLEAAETSARSVRSVTPGISIAIATDEPAPTGFDAVVPLSEPDGYRAKVVGMLASPFERTLFLDADTYAAADVGELFRLLDAFDVAAAHAPNRVTLELDDVPDSFPELNTGVIAFRRTTAVERLLQAWLEEYDRLQPLHPRSEDQPAFRRALYAATDVRVAVLPTEFNVRFGMAGFYNQRARILHGPGDEDDYRAVAALLNDRVASWRHRGVFIGRTVLDERAREVGRFPKKPDLPS
jgi:Nucleotide-diphospho-sugar transferase